VVVSPYGLRRVDIYTKLRLPDGSLPCHLVAIHATATKMPNITTISMKACHHVIVHPFQIPFGAYFLSV
jgi:hypothetical protein